MIQQSIMFNVISEEFNVCGDFDILSKYLHNLANHLGLDISCQIPLKKVGTGGILSKLSVSINVPTQSSALLKWK